MLRALVVLLLIIQLVYPVSNLHACSIPVFRYALECWEADPYEVIVFRRGPLSQQEQAIMDHLREMETNETAPANIVVQDVDLAETPPPEMEKLWLSQPQEQLPWLVLRFPQNNWEMKVVWSGRFTEKAAQMLVDSPARHKIAKRILEGDSTVWVLLESGDERSDDAAEKLLQVELRRVKNMLRSSAAANDEETEWKSVQDDESAGWGPGIQPELPWKLNFSLIRLSRNDAAEEPFVNMLLKSEPNLRGLAKIPMAFPVFGRGRVLCTLAGKGINRDTIEEICTFLTCGCSCQIKAANPGVDLLTAVNWKEVLEDRLVADEELPSFIDILPSPAYNRSGDTPALRDESARPANAADHGGGLLGNALFVIAALAVVVGLATIALRLRKKRT